MKILLPALASFAIMSVQVSAQTCLSSGLETTPETDFSEVTSIHNG